MGQGLGKMKAERMDGIELGVQGSELSLAAISSFGASCRSHSLGAS